MSIAGPVYHVRVTPGLTGPVRLTLAVPAPTRPGVLAGPQVPLLAFYDTATRRWQPVPATYNAAARTISATTRHLSIWTVLRVDTGKILSDATSLLKGFIGLADTTSQPTCPGGAQLTADHVKVTSDSGSLLKWCAGVSGSETPLLRVADNRSYAVETDYPANWSASRVGPADPVTTQLLASAAKILSVAPPGQAPIIIPGGDTVQFDVPAGSSGLASTSPSSEAYLIDAFLYGAETLAMTLDDIPGAPRSNPSATARAISLAFKAKDCVSQIDALAHGDVSTAHSAGELFRSDIELAVGCLGEQWKQAYGISGFIGQFVVSLLLWLEDGIKLVVNGLRAAIDTAIYWRNYRIAISQTATQPWTAQQLTITPRGLGSVTIGMTIAQASAAAGVPLTVLGDGASGPRGGKPPGLSVGSDPITCVAAQDVAHAPRVLTPQGFPLGGTLAQLKAVYGTSLRFVPAPTGGIAPFPGYVAALPGGNLAFLVSNGGVFPAGTVYMIVGGPGVLPSTSCA